MAATHPMILAPLTLLSLGHLCIASDSAPVGKGHKEEPNAPEAQSSDFPKNLGNFSRGDYQQYYQQYLHKSGAKDYSKSMSDYQKFLHSSALDGQKQADYEKYLGTAGQNDGEQKAGERAGHFQKYVTDYKKYMGNSPVNMLEDARDHQKYVKDYMKHTGATRAEKGKGSGADDQQYMDFQKFMSDYNKYMHSGAQGASKEAGDFRGYANGYGGDYQKYMADYQKYMHTRSGGEQPTSADYQKFLQAYSGEYQKHASDFHKYLDAAAQERGSMASVEPGSTASSDGQNVTELVEMGKLGNLSLQASGDDQLRRKYMDQYAARFNHFAQRQQSQELQGPRAPASAQDCQNLTQLKAWRHATLKPIKDYVPKAYRSKAEDQVEQIFQRNLARIMNATQTEKTKQVEEEKSQSQPAEASRPSQQSGKGKGADKAEGHPKQEEKPRPAEASRPSMGKAEDAPKEERAAKPRVVEVAKEAHDGPASASAQTLAAKAPSGDAKVLGTVGLVCVLGAAFSGVAVARHHSHTKDAEGYKNMEEP